MLIVSFSQFVARSCQIKLWGGRVSIPMRFDFTDRPTCPEYHPDYFSRSHEIRTHSAERHLFYRQAQLSNVGGNLCKRKNPKSLCVLGFLYLVSFFRLFRKAEDYRLRLFRNKNRNPFPTHTVRDNLTRLAT